MTRAERHDGEGSSDVPEVITLSDDEFALLSAHMTGGSFDAPADPQVSEIPTIIGESPVQQGAGINSQPASLPQQEHGGGSRSGTFGSPAQGTPGSGLHVSPAVTRPSGSFGSPNATGGVRGGSRGFLREGGAIPDVVRASGPSSFRGFLSRLPELWGLDLALTLMTIGGVVMIAMNLSEILIGIAEIVYELLDGALSIGVLIAAIAIGAWYLFGRRRRR